MQSGFRHEQTTDRFDERLRIHRLRQKGLATAHDLVLARFGGGDEGREEENRLATEQGIGVQLAGDFAAVFSRHVDIEEDGGRVNGPGGGDRVGGTVFLKDFVLLRLLEEELYEA